MIVSRASTLVITAALAGFGSTVAWAQTTVPQQGGPDGQYGMQVMTRGPVHEAFAETITFDPEPGINVRRQPPNPIEELPPDQRPEGANVDWIPGYWAWDDERDDFLWVSGVWRALPPGRDWVPGYWGRSGQDFQWISGYWADAQRSEIEYLPEPPATVEIGPNISQPSAGHGWIPGSWVWYEGRYAWRPGYWLIVQPDWDWIPAHYVCSPRGYVFVDGYWDYSVNRRGVLYAPVRFEANSYARAGFSYSPTTVIDLAVFSDHLFVRPQSNHYYFGDYYAASYRDSGFYASFSFQSGQRGYDPIYARQRSQHGQDPDWERRVEADFWYRRDHEDARPLHTLAAQTKLITSEGGASGRTLVVATSLDQLARSTTSRLRVQPVQQAERQVLSQRGNEVQKFREERQRLETSTADPRTGTPSREHSSAKAILRRSPIVAKPTAQLGKDDSPPERPQPPQTDPKVERKAKKKAEKH